MKARLFILCLLWPPMAFAGHVEYTLNVNHVVRATQFGADADYNLCIYQFNTQNSPIQGIGTYSDLAGLNKAIRFIDTGTQQTLTQALPDLGDNSRAFGINSSKRAVGTISDPQRLNSLPVRNEAGLITTDGLNSINYVDVPVEIPVYWDSTPDPDQLNNWFNELGSLPVLHNQGTGQARAINDAGTIVINGSLNLNYDTQEFAVNTLSQDIVVTYSRPLFRAYAHQGSNQTLLPLLPGGRYSEAFSINQAGQIAGYSETDVLITLTHPNNNTVNLQRSARHATVWSNNTVTDLHALIPVAMGAVESQAMGISDNGKIAGFYMTASGGKRAIVWDGDTVIDISQGVESVTLSINVNDIAVGYYGNPDHVAFHFDLAQSRHNIIDMILPDDMAARFGGEITNFTDALYINNSNAVSGCGFNFVGGVNSGFGYLTAPNGADLDVSISAQPNPVVAGNVSSFSIPIRNRGPLHANNVVLNVALPGNVDINRAEHRIALSNNVLPEPEACTINPNNTVQCNIPLVPAQFAAHVLIMVDTNEPGDVTITAGVSADEDDPFPFNDNKQFTLEVDACFIATAAYGSTMANDVQLLRNFRDRFMKPYALGQFFVETYYDISPPIAQFIQARPWARALTRAALSPLVFSIKHPIAGLIIGLLIIAVFTRLIRKLYRYRLAFQ